MKIKTTDPLLDIIPGDQSNRKTNLNRLSDVDQNIQAVRSEFIGMPEVCHQLATQIIHLRRDPSSATHSATFYRLWMLYEAVFLEHLNVRWLISVCDTLVDTATPHQSAVAMNIVQCINRCNLDVTLLLNAVNGTLDRTKLSQELKVKTWGGMINADVPTGDMLHNMMMRLESVVQGDQLCYRIWRKIVEHSRNEPNVIMEYIAGSSKFKHQQEFFK